MRKKLPLIIGLVLAIIAGVMIKLYVDQQQQSVVAEAKRKIEKMQASQTAVLVAKKDVLQGTVLEKDMLDVTIVPNQFVQPQAATSLDRVTGMMTMTPLSKGEQITLNKLVLSRDTSSGGGSLAMATPIGKRAITVSIDNISAVGGMLRPGDYVDVSAVLNVPVQTAPGKTSTQAAVVPLFQNVLLLAVGQETASVKTSDSRYKKEEKREPSPAITLALSPQEANILAFVQEQGKLRLSLRSPSDAKVEAVQPASWDSLFQFMMPPRDVLDEQKRKEQKPAEEPGEFIEIYRGLNKDKLPISKER